MFSIKPLIYVAGPYTVGNQSQNVYNALHFGDYLLSRGATPYIPHLSHHWSLSTIGGSERTYDEWMDICFNVLHRCNALVRLRGESPGSEMEVEYAKELQIPIFLENETELIEEFIKKCTQGEKQWIQI